MKNQGHRNQADYNLSADFYSRDASHIIDTTEFAINQLSSTLENMRRAFAVTTLLRNRSA